MDYSKWKKILIILMIINLCFIIFSRFTKVFGATNNDYFSNCESLEKHQTSFNVGDFSLTVPDFIYNYNNIICCALKSSNSNTRNGILLFTNNKILFNNGTFYGEENVPGYYWKTFNYTLNQDFSNYSLSDFSYNGYAPGFIPSWSGYISTNPDFSKKLLLGSIYDYTNSNDLIIEKQPFKKPVFDNSHSEIQTLDFDYLFINPRDYGTDNKLYFKLLEVTNVVENQEDATQNVYYYNDLTFSFDKNSKYIKEFFDSDTFYYALPYSALKLKKDKSYYFVLTNNNTQINQSVGELVVNDNIYDIILCDTQNLITTSDEILNSIINNNPSDNTNNNINNNLPRPGYNDTDNNINIPGMNVDIPDDVTTSSFNFIFSTIYNAITSEPRPIEFTIPFIHYSFTISPYFIDEWLQRFNVTVAGGNSNIVLDLIHSFYYFIISYYILNDIRKNIEKVKSGDIMTHTDTNIKADML